MMPGEVQIISWLQYSVIKCTVAKWHRLCMAEKTPTALVNMARQTEQTLRAKLNGSSEVCHELTRL